MNITQDHEEKNRFGSAHTREGVPVCRTRCWWSGREGFGKKGKEKHENKASKLVPLME